MHPGHQRHRSSFDHVFARSSSLCDQPLYPTTYSPAASCNPRSVSLTALAGANEPETVRMFWSCRGDLFFYNVAARRYVVSTHSGTKSLTPPTVLPTLYTLPLLRRRSLSISPITPCVIVPATAIQTRVLLPFSSPESDPQPRNPRAPDQDDSGASCEYQRSTGLTALSRGSRAMCEVKKG